ncbi:hypothetical protein D3C85_1820290 [compost metagenome]
MRDRGLIEPGSLNLTRAGTHAAGVLNRDGSILLSLQDTDYQEEFAEVFGVDAKAFGLTKKGKKEGAGKKATNRSSTLVTGH